MVLHGSMYFILNINTVAYKILWILIDNHFTLSSSNFIGVWSIFFRLLYSIRVLSGQTVTIHIKNKSFFLEGSTDDWRKIFDVNVMALCICTREAIKVMRQKKIAGHIIHINSVVGHQVPVLPKPNFNVYPASKHAVTALTETLRQELCYNHSPIKVSVSIKWSKQSRAKVCFARNNACRRLQSLFFF